MSPTVHIVPHTHWDREWYHPAARFQVRLARVVDEVMTLLEQGRLPVFLLDGQSIVLDDYMLLRPDAVSSTSSTTRRPRAAAAARSSARASRGFCSRVETRW